MSFLTVSALCIAVGFFLVPILIGSYAILLLQNSRLEILPSHEASPYLGRTFAKGIVCQDWAAECGFEPMGA